MISTKTLIASALSFCAATGMVNAQSVSSAFDGELAFTYIHAPNDSFDYRFDVTGGLVYAFAPQLAVQLDFGSYHYGDGYSYGSLGLHLIYSVTDNLDVGVAFENSGENFDFDEPTVTLETRYHSGDLAIEAFAMHYLDYREYTDFGLEVSYALASASSSFSGLGGVWLYGGFANEAYDGDLSDISSIYVGARFGIGNGFLVDTRASTYDGGDYNYFAIGLVREFGNGTRFNQRGFYSNFPGY